MDFHLKIKDVVALSALTLVVFALITEYVFGQQGCFFCWVQRWLLLVFSICMYRCERKFFSFGVDYFIAWSRSWFGANTFPHVIYGFRCLCGLGRWSARGAIHVALTFQLVIIQEC